MLALWEAELEDQTFESLPGQCSKTLSQNSKRTGDVTQYKGSGYQKRKEHLRLYYAQAIA